MPEKLVREKQSCWFLENNSPDIEGKWTMEVEPFPFKIGRTDDNNLVLRSNWVSRYHAEINLSGKLLWIRDVGSTNGTYVNHQRINEAQELKEFDTVNFGRTELKVKRNDSVDIDLSSSKTQMLDMTKELEITSMAFRLEPELRSLLKNRSVVPHYQSIIDITTSEIVGYEVLGRIPEESGLPKSPVELFKIASYLNLSTELSDLFRVEGASIWPGLAGSPLLFLNTHPSEISRIDELEKSLVNLRKTAPDAPIVIEVHERAVPSIAELRRLRHILTDLGMKLAYDDFGVGQTRLVELAQTPPDYLKFDISIIRNIHLAPKSLHQMVLTFVKASHDLGIATLAEGVSQKGERDKCREIGFQYAQGFLFCRPTIGSNL